MSFEVRTTVHFEKEAKKIAKKYPSLKNDLEKLIFSLEKDPTQGQSLGNDFYKIRINITSKAKGKSGGGRLITCVKIMRKQVFLAAIYDKSEKDTVTEKELKYLAKNIPL